MKKVLTLALAVVVLSVFTGLATAGTTVKESKSTGDNVATDKSTSTKLMTGKVMEVNNQAKTFTVMAKGKAFTFGSKSLKALPKIGEIIDITYTENPGGPMEATTVKGSKSKGLSE